MLLKCDYENCGCRVFSPQKSSCRICETCHHDWISHALKKLCSFALNNEDFEPVALPSLFDISSLILWGTTGIPIRTHILLDRLFSVTRHEDVLQILLTFNWRYQDYARGYMLQDHLGRELIKWNIISKEDEKTVLYQFLRFAESRTLAAHILKEEYGEVNLKCPEVQHNPESIVQKYFHGVYNYTSAFATSQINVPYSWNMIPSYAHPLGQTYFSPNCIDAVQRFSPLTYKELLLNRSTPFYFPKSDQAAEDQVERKCVIYDEIKSQDTCNSEEQNNNGAVTKPYTVEAKRTRRSSNDEKNKASNSHGKRRVQCMSCKKTFCDKGALKIHYSAVHLREMHKCTVHGCNMLFSSRRSRNRHSANPNPKLHFPKSMSHRYQAIGPLVTDTNPSIAGVILAEAEKRCNEMAKVSRKFNTPFEAPFVFLPQTLTSTDKSMIPFVPNASQIKSCTSENISPTDQKNISSLSNISNKNFSVETKLSTEDESDLNKTDEKIHSCESENGFFVPLDLSRHDD